MTAWPQQDIDGMQLALQQARLAEAGGDVPVGAVVLIQGSVVGVGHNRTLVDSDPSGHAEVVALRAAAAAVGNHRLPGATLYVTLEPCMMCVGCIVQARIQRIIFGAYDAKAGALGSVEDFAASRALNHRFEVSGGCLAEDCADLLQRFFRSRR